MFGYEPELRVLWRFSQSIYEVWRTEQGRKVARWRWSRLKNDQAYQGVPELKEVLDWLAREKFDKTQAFTQQPTEERQKTNNHVERMNRKLRFDEKARYKWRKRKSIVRFILLRISRHVPQPKTHQQQPPPKGGG
jgi:hypothetical protein